MKQQAGQNHRFNKPDNIRNWTVTEDGTLLETAKKILKDHTLTKVKSMMKHMQFAVNHVPHSQYDFPVTAGDTFSVNFDQSFAVFYNKRIELIYEDEHILVINKGYGVLSMADATGMPYGIPLNFVWDGNDCFYVHCAPEGRKLRMISENRNVSFCIVGNVSLKPQLFTTAYESVVLRGEASVVESDEERREALRLLVKKFSPEYEDDTLYLKLSVRTDAERCKCLSVKLYVGRQEAGK